MARFFINRPIVAIVISIITVVAGLLAMRSLPVAQYPSIIPPQIIVNATFTGADAVTVEQSVATPLEQQMNGVDDMLYMQSTNANDGTMALTVTFDIDTDPNIDQVNVTNRVAQAQPNLPPDVNQFGLSYRKSTGLPMLVISLYSPHQRYDALFLANYANININDALYRVRGVGEVRLFGASDYAMRIWLKPDVLAKLGLTVPDLVRAVQQQSTVNPAGRVGADPAPPGKEMTYTVRAQGRLQSAEEFAQIVVRSNPDGSVVRLTDVARIELGALNYQQVSRVNGQPGSIVAVFQAPGSNALDVARGVKSAMAELKQRFPPDLDYMVTLDSTLPVTEGISEIAKTILEAMALVTLVVYLFLQNWRATLIPLIAVPVSLIGTFAVFPLLGFSINTLSLFGLVLAIGLVVDDAIVVVEAVEHHIEEGLSPRDAAFKAMEQVSGPVVAIALILAAVFVPTAFIPGITGRMYQQFAVTIAVSVLISAFNALTLSPALSALLLRPRREMRGPLGVFFRGIKYYTGVAGFSLLSLVTTTYNSFYFITLDDWDARDKKGLTADVIIQKLNQRLAGVAEAQVFAFSPPAIPGIGTSGGVTFMLEDRAGRDPAFLAENTEKFLVAARKRPEFARLFTTLLPSAPQFFAEVDRDKVLKQGITLASVYQALQAFLGGAFVNYFNQYGRVWQVYVQAEGEFRTRAENVGQFYVRNATGQAVPLSTLVTMRQVNGPEFTTRFNEYRAAQINGILAPGFSTRQGMRALEEVFAQTMSRDMGFDYSGMSFQEKVAEEGIPPTAVFGFSLLVVFLLLAAQYESWTLPFGVLLGTPIAVLGAVGALWLGRLELDVFSQIGLVMVIGLAAKNAILIVEFAKEEYERGAALVDAALAGARVRLRPILMTAFAFILGVLPLVISKGAGANSRRILGTTVVGGMLAATLIAIFIIPVTFYVSERFGRKREKAAMPDVALAPIRGGTDDAPPAEGRRQ